MKPYKHTIESLNANKKPDSRLTAISFAETRVKPNGDRYRMVECVCNCGNKTKVSVFSISSGTSLSCGCLMIERTKKANTKFFPVIEDIYSSWLAMIRRCYNKKYDGYRYYGGRGVIVCDEWKNDYQKFLDWSLVNGWQPGFEIDKDIKGNGMLYSPDTCLWVSKEDNNETKSNSVRNFGAYKDGKLIHSFRDIKEAMAIIGGKRCSYTLALNGTRKTLFGYTLKFLNDETRNNSAAS